MKKKNRRHRTKESKSQKKRKKKLRHFGFQSPSDFGNPLVKQNWDSNKTLKENYKTLGLLANNEKIVENETVRMVSKASAQAIVDELDRIASRPKAETLPTITIREQKTLRALMEKYGTDYQAMARDMKLNIYQKTEAQLRRRIQMYEKLLSMIGA